jgi:[CysO sulfur-carrier protein]-S-L-cysteine hydrolase
MDDSVRIKREVFDRLLAEARSNPNMECCGFLAGKDGIISVILPARNALQSAKAFEIAPQELFALLRRMRSEGLQHLGIYHSHPTAENIPSPTDLELAFYPDAAYVIVSPNTRSINAVRAFRIIEARAQELSVEIV